MVREFAISTSQVEDHDEVSELEEDAALVLQQRRGPLRTAGFLLGMAAIGTVLALIWNYSELPVALAKVIGGTSSSIAAAKSERADELSRVTKDLEAVQKRVAELTQTIEQIKTGATALQSSQQELRQQLSSRAEPAHWYSDLEALQLRFALPKAAGRSTTTRIAAPETTATTRRSEATPLALQPHQP
ncbi:MAG: hypothetical protein ACJ8F3_07915 [Xanthobacteraceae bacterium]